MRKKSFKTENGNTSNFTLLYTCLTLLLLCFFIFLVANSVIDPQRKKVVIGSLIGAFGSLNSGISLTGDSKQEKLGFNLVPLSKNKRLIEDLIEIVKFYKRDKILIESEGNNISVKFKKKSIFNNQSVKINKRYFPVLNRIFNRVLNERNLTLKIVTYYPDPYIAVYRAFYVASFFINSKKIDINKVDAYGEIMDNNYELQIKFSGSFSYNRNNNRIKYEDFIFQVK